MVASSVLPSLALCLVWSTACASANAHTLGDCEALPKTATPSQSRNSDAALLQIKIQSSDLPIIGQEAVQQTAGNSVQASSPQGLANATCSLPPLATIGKVVRQEGACEWTPQNASAESDCVYDLVGLCNSYHHEVSACNFFGHFRNQSKMPARHQYVPASLVLPGPATGEIALSTEEESVLSKPFERCDSRPRYFLVDKQPFADPDHPLAFLAGGVNMATHFYFVAAEIAKDSYHLKDQAEEDMKLIVDVGANVGLFAIAACKLFPKSRILAFEPHPANYRFLRYNLAVAGCEHIVESFNTGLSRDGQPMKLFWHDSIGTSAYRPGDNHVQMQTITPESLWKIIGSDVVSLMKIDCEGCEYEIVPLIQKSQVQQLYCEVHGETINSGSNVSSDVSSEIMSAVEKTCRDGNPFDAVVK